MKPFSTFHGLLMGVLALTLSSDAVAQDKPTSAAVPIKDLTPPPPKPTDGKHLIAPTPLRPTGNSTIDLSQEGKWSFQGKDKNADGKLTREELPERMRPGFSHADANSDGFISQEEYLAYLGMGAPVKGTAKARDSALPFGVEAFRDLAYADTDNPRQRLDLYLPKDPKGDKPLPVVVFIHGGGWRKGDKSAGAANVTRLVQSREYAGISVGYRLSDEAQWPAQIHDCKAAIRWIKAHAAAYFLDPAKIGVWGTSAGGHLVSMLGTSGDVKELEGSLGKNLNQDSRVTCVVNYFGPQDFVTMIRQPSSIDRTRGRDYPEALLLGGPVPEREAVAKEASPVTHISAGDSPFFTAHGTKDPLVPFAQAEELHAALTKAGVPSILQQVTNGGHGLRSTDLDQRVKQFLDLHLQGIKTEIVTSPIEVVPVKK
ncbi:MAG: alpha/beta hydrolase fold domain-containing protein [Prosthecobacter sp.]|nr:alpha/beta hydrolase fold domain-containing protein [Prosthecobacter sp.]